MADQLGLFLLPPSGNIGGLKNYSTSEQTSGRRWIDGKHIYQKTVSVGSLLASGTKTVAHGITGIGKLTNAKVFAWHSTDVTTLIPRLGNLTNQLDLTVNATNIVIAQGAGQDYSSFTCWATLYYTKA